MATLDIPIETDQIQLELIQTSKLEPRKARKKTKPIKSEPKSKPVQYIAIADFWDSATSTYYKRGDVLSLTDQDTPPPHCKQV